ncbi:MAG: MBL fold metallo-hydrolase [Gemmatimonadetes bacterium]|nr:MBL fold metallo-hydrolase [Gemmatimonadota bacterium]
MLQVTVLGSGSRGNAILVDGSEGAFLVDCGFGPRTLARRLADAQRRPESIRGVLLTHEHADHACGVSAASRRWQWPVHATAATHVALTTEACGAPPHRVMLDDTPTIAGFDVAHHRVPHDAADCRAFVLTDRASGARLGVVLDCGHVPETLPAFLARCDLLVLESNHCPTMLANGPYPWPLKQRIRGGSGHLSNADAGRVLADVVHPGLRGVLLAHLSETNNTPDLAVTLAREALRKAGWRRDGLWAAPQRAPLAPVQMNGSLGARAAQLSLAFG